MNVPLLIKTILKKRVLLSRPFLPVMFSLLVLLALIPLDAMGAQSNILYAVRSAPPISTTLQVNDLITVEIGAYSSADKAAGSVSGSVSFASDTLEVVKTDSAGSEFQKLTITINTGSIGFSASRTPSLLGINQIFLITFKMLKAGSTTVGFNQGSIVDSSTTVYSPYTFSINSPSPSPASSPIATAPVSPTSPAPTPKLSTSPSSTTSSGSSSNTKSSTNQPKPRSAETSQSQTNINSVPIADTSALSDYVAPKPDVSGLIDGVFVDTKYNSASIVWKVNVNEATTRLDFGSTSSKLDKSVPSTKNPEGAYVASLPLLSPGVRYYFNITATEPGKTDNNYSGALITRGYPSTFSITENGSPITSAQIKIGNQSYAVGTSGKKTVGLAAGRYSVTIATNSASQVKDIVVTDKAIPTDGSPPENQYFEFALSSSILEGGPGSSQSVLGFIGVMIAGTVILVIIFLLVVTYRRRRFEQRTISSGSGSSNVVIEDGYSWRDRNK